MPVQDSYSSHTRSGSSPRGNLPGNCELRQREQLDSPDTAAGTGGAVQDGYGGRGHRDLRGGPSDPGSPKTEGTL